jgi:hypothetical protein
MKCESGEITLSSLEHSLSRAQAGWQSNLPPLQRRHILALSPVANAVIETVPFEIEAEMAELCANEFFGTRGHLLGRRWTPIVSSSFRKREWLRIGFRSESFLNHKICSGIWYGSTFSSRSIASSSSPSCE